MQWFGIACLPMWLIYSLHHLYTQAGLVHLKLEKRHVSKYIIKQIVEYVFQKYCEMHIATQHCAKWVMAIKQGLTELKYPQIRDSCSTSWYFPLVTTRGYQTPFWCSTDTSTHGYIHKQNNFSKYILYFQGKIREEWNSKDFGFVDFFIIIWRN